MLIFRLSHSLYIYQLELFYRIPLLCFVLDSTIVLIFFFCFLTVCVVYGCVCKCICGRLCLKITSANAYTPKVFLWASIHICAHVYVQLHQIHTHKHTHIGAYRRYFPPKINNLQSQLSVLKVLTVLTIKNKITLELKRWFSS